MSLIIVLKKKNKGLWNDMFLICWINKCFLKTTTLTCMCFFFALQGGIMEIMVLRSVMGFDAQAMAWKVRGGTGQTDKIRETKLSPEMIKSMDTGMYSDHVKFVMSLNQLTRANKTILTLLFVIELFSSDRPSLKNKELVAKGQEKFSTWLQAYLESIYPVSEARQLYPKLLMKLLDVRSLGESSAQLASHLDITRLEPLLVEIFSLQKWHQMTRNERNGI